MIRVAVAGAAGRMGRALIDAISDTDGLTLGAAFERAASPAVGQDAGAERRGSQEERHASIAR